MKKRTDSAAVGSTASPTTSIHTARARLQAAKRSFALAGRAVNRGSSGYEHARISAELATIAERRTAFDR